MKSQTILITGGAGFIGSALASYYAKRQHTIVILDNFTRNSFQYLEKDSISDNIILRTGNVLSECFLKELFREFRFDMVFHLAAIAGVSKYFSIPVDVMRTNIIGTANVVEACKESSSVSLFVDFSTSEIYGSSCYGVDEDANIKLESMYERRWTYALSKVASERLAYAYMWQYNLPILCVRPFNIYGPGQTGEGVISNFLKAAISDETLFVTGNGQQIRSYCYIDDFVKGFDLLVENFSKLEHYSYNIGDDTNACTIIDLAKRIIRLLNSDSEISFKEHLGSDVITRSPSIDRLRKLGYIPSTSIEDGIIATHKWFKSHAPTLD